MSKPEGSAAGVYLPEYMTTAELATLTRTPESTVRYWRRNGRGPRGTQIGRRVLYDRAVVADWLASLGTPKVTA